MTVPSPNATKALNYAAKQHKLLGHTLFQNVGQSTAPNDFRAYTASIPIKIPIDELPDIRAAVIRRMDLFTRMFER